ncbi:MAG: PspC domain-containing protein [Flavobacteriales bacterium]
MNKTISIHLQGVPFLFEDQAYDALENYLNRIRKILESEEGCEDIIQDVELRIIELLQEKGLEQNRVVTAMHLEEILVRIGKPEDFYNDESTKDTRASSDHSSPKRLFRDKDTAILGGVCSGIAAYLSIDVIVVRALYILAFLSLGAGILLYLILWIIVPAAKTSSEKLQMKGQAVNLNNLRTEFEQAAQRIKVEAENVKNKVHLKTGITRIFLVFSRILGVLSLCFSFALLLVFLSFLAFEPSVWPIPSDGTFLSLQDLGKLTFENLGDYRLLLTGISLVILSIIFQGFLFGIRLLKTIKSNYFRGISIGLTLICIAGVVFIFLAGINLSHSFRVDVEVESPVRHISGKTLTLQTKDRAHSSSPLVNMNGPEETGWFSTKNNQIIMDGVAIQFKRSTDSLFHISEQRHAAGSTHESAIRKARNISFPIVVKDSTVWVAPTYSFPKTDKFRNQRLTLIVSVPEGGKVNLNGHTIFPQRSQPNAEIQAHGYLKRDGTFSAW